MPKQSEGSGTGIRPNPPGKYGAGNLLIEDTSEKVTITFDPRVIIGRFNPSAKAQADGRDGNPKVASTRSFRTLDISGVRLMLHVIGQQS